MMAKITQAKDERAVAHLCRRPMMRYPLSWKRDDVEAIKSCFMFVADKVGSWHERTG